MKTAGYLCVAERHSNTATSSLRNKKTKKRKDAVEDADEVEDEDEESIGLKMTRIMMKMKIFF